MFRIYLPAVLIACSAASTVWSNFVAAEDWPQWRGPDRSNRSVETGLFDAWGDAGPELEWIAKGVGEGYASVSVANGRAFTTGNFENTQSAVAVDVATGKVIWRTPITDSVPKHGYDGSRTTPTVDEDRLYMVSSDGRIVCLQASDGEQVWSRDFDHWGGKMMSGWGFSESPLVDGDKVICTPGGREAVMVCLDKRTGEAIWESKWPADREQTDNLKNGAGYASAVISEGGGVRQYIQMVGQGLIGVRASDGQVLWVYDRVANRVANIPTAIVDGDLVFASTGYNTGSALLRLSAAGAEGRVDAEEVYWLDSRDLQNKHGGITLVDGYVYCGHGNGSGLPICVEMASGRIAWGPERAEGRGETSMIAADGHLLMRRQDGTVLLVRANPDEFDLVGTMQPAVQEKKSWAHPVIANGRLYLREQNQLMCYRLK